MSDVEASLQVMEWQSKMAFEHGIHMGERTIQAVGPVDEAMFKLIDSGLTLLESQGRGGITIKINSSGGGAYDGHAIAARIRASKCKITTEGYGAIMSAATMVFAAGHKRRLSRYSVVMVHESSAEFAGKSLEMKAYAQWCVQEEILYCQLMADLTETSIKIWKRIIGSGRDKYLVATEAVELGMAHETF